jgi:hypothetical protein
MAERQALFYIPGKQVGDLVDRMVADAGNDVAKVGLGVEAMPFVELCRAQAFSP